MPTRTIPVILISFLLINISCSRPSGNPGLVLTISEQKALLDTLKVIESNVEKLKYTDSRKCIASAHYCLRLKNLAEFPKGLIKANIILAEAYLPLKIDSGFYYISESSRISNQFGIRDYLGEIWYDLSKVYSQAMDYKMSILYLDSVIHDQRTPSRFDLISNGYNDLGVIKLNLHDYADAKRLFNTSLRIANDHSLIKQKAVALGNLATLENDPAVATTLLKEDMIKLQNISGAETAIAQILIDIRNRCNTPDSAIHYYQSAINLVDTGTNSEILLTALNNLAYGYMEKKDFATATVYLEQKALPLAKKWKNYDWFATLQDTYADLLKAMERPREAIIAEKDAYRYREQAYDLKVTGQLRLLALVLDVKEKELQIQSEQRIIQQKSSKIRILVIIIGILPVLFGLIWILGKQRRKYLLERQRLISAEKILKMDETFRGRMAMELHDMTSPLYTSLSMQIEDVLVSENTIKEILLGDLKILTERIRNISHKIAGGYYEELSFIELVEGLCEEMQERSDVRIILEKNQDEFPMKGERIHHAFRIIQELLTNGIKYVKKGEIRIKLSLESNNLNIIYRDNGEGFFPEKVKGKGLGLTNIIERANLIRGKAILVSSPGNGTHWTIIIPTD